MLSVTSCGRNTASSSSGCSSFKVFTCCCSTLIRMVLQQQTKALQEERPETGAEVSKRLESLKHLLWHGNTQEALERLGDLLMELSFIQARSNAAKKVVDGLDDFRTYICNNREFIPNFGERRRQGETISTAFVESTINQGEHFKPGARKSRGVVHLIGWPRNGTRFSARSLLCPRLDSGDPPDALAALSRTIRQHPGRSSRPLADRLRLDGLPSPSLSHPQEGLRRATPWRARLPRCTGNQAGGPALSHQ